MVFDKHTHHRRSIRIHEYDYAQSGAYFITICTYEKVCLFGKILGREMVLNGFGKIVRDEWFKTAEMRKNITLDAFVVMPNHVHGIIVIEDQNDIKVSSPVGAYCNTPLQSNVLLKNNVLRSPSRSIGSIIRGFKATVTKQLNILRNTPGIPLWQRNYYEHVIRDESEWEQIRSYIENNPSNWEEDKLYCKG